MPKERREKKRDENSQLEMLEDEKSMGAGAATIASAGSDTVSGLPVVEDTEQSLDQALDSYSYLDGDLDSPLYVPL